MAERTAEGGVLLRLQLDKDGKPFVQQVDQAMSGANAAVSKGAKAAGKSFGEILGSGFVLKAAAATVVLRRLTSSAGDASPEFRILKREAAEAGKAIGTDLQFALGSVLTVAKPFLDWIEQSSSATRGLLTGTVLASTAMGPFKAALVALGIPGAQATAILLGLGAALGALAGRAANEAKATEASFNSLVGDIVRQGEDIATASRDEVKQRLADQERLLRDHQDKLKEIRQQGATADVTGGVGAARTGFAQTSIAAERDLEGAVSATESQIEKLKTQLQAYDEAFKLFARQNVSIPDAELAIGEFVQRQQLAIAMGEKTLSAAREAIKKRRDEVQADLDILQDVTRSYAPVLPEISALFTKLAGGDSVEGEKLRLKFVSDIVTQKRLIGQAEKDDLTLLQAQLDLTDRIAESNQKTLSTELNRKVLQAQLVDALRGMGPVLEKQVLEEERRRLAIDEGGRAKTRILELDNEILNLSQQITQVEARRAELSKQESDARWRDEVTQFQSAYLDNLNIEIALSKLAAESDQQFRRQRIQDLSQELGLRSLTVQSLEDELATINASAAIAPELAAQRRQQLQELIGLLGEEKAALSDSGQELQVFTDGFRRLSEQASLALVQTFTRGKAEVKDFAEFALQTFEKMFSELLSRQVVLAFLSLFTGGFGGTAAGGSGGLPLPYDFGGAGAARLGPRPGLPSLPSPIAAQAGSLGRLEAKLDSVVAAVSGLKFQTGEFRIKGKDLVASYQLTEASTPQLKTVK